jgi:hypothetical protein
MGVSTSLANGDHVASWRTSDGASDYQVHVQLYSPQGAPIGPAFSETAPPVSLFTAPVAAALTNDAYEAAWVQQSNYASQLLAEHFTAQGTAAGQATLAAYGGFSTIGAASYALAGLADGDFVAAWTVQDGLNGGPPQVWAETFTASGAPAGHAIELGTAASSGPAPVIEAEADGRYVVSWTSPSGPEREAFTEPGAAPWLMRSLAASGAAPAAHAGGVAGAEAHSAPHPFASAADSLTDPVHAAALNAHAASFI